MTKIDESPRRKAYSYMRFSRPEQARGASQKRQLEMAAAYARENNLDLDETLRDAGISAYRGKNREAANALGAFLARVDSGDIPPGSVLLVESFDRLSREEVVVALEFFLSLTRKEITIVTLADGRVYNRDSIRSDQTQLLISIIIMSRAYEESATKAKRVGDAWARKRDSARIRKQAMTARCPGWVRLVGGPREGRYELIPERSALVAKIFEDVIAGDGRRTITNRLNAQGIEPWGSGRSKGKFWHDSYIQKIVTSHASYGRYDKGGQSIAGYFPAAISEETFWRASAATALRSRSSGGAGKHFHNILSGICRCHACDSTMIYVDKGKKSKPKLTCSKAVNRAGCDARETYTYAFLEWYVLGFVYPFLPDVSAFAVDPLQRASADLIAELEAKGDNLAQQMKQLIELAKSGGAIPALREEMDTLQAETDAVRKEIEAARRDLAKAVNMIDGPELRYRQIRTLINQDDPEMRYQARARLNSRLKYYLEKFVITPDQEVEPFVKAAFQQAFHEAIDRDIRENGATHMEMWHDDF